MKPNEKLVQLHGSVIGNREIIEREIFIIKGHASLTADVALRFNRWMNTQGVFCGKPFYRWKEGMMELEEKPTPQEELLDYFINNVYKPE